MLEEYDIYDYSLYSEPVLKYIMAGQKDTTLLEDNKNEVLILPIQKEKSKLEQLELELKSIGVDSRVIYKYTFVKNFILKDKENDSTKVKEIAKIIQKSEDEWVTKKEELMRQLKI
jgi:hypothetical protein